MNKIFEALLSKPERDIFSWVQKINDKSSESLFELSQICMEYLVDNYHKNAILILNSIATMSENVIKEPDKGRKIILNHLDKLGMKDYLFSSIFLAGEGNQLQIKQYLSKVNDLNLFAFSNFSPIVMFADTDIVKSFIRIFRSGYQVHMYFNEDYDGNEFTEEKRVVNLQFLKAIKEMDVKDLNGSEDEKELPRDSIYSYINKIISIKMKVEDKSTEFTPLSEIKTIDDIYSDIWALDYFADDYEKIISVAGDRKLDNFIADQLMVPRAKRANHFMPAPSVSTFTGRDFLKWNRLKEGDIEALTERLVNDKINFYDLSFAAKQILKYRTPEFLTETALKMSNTEAAGQLINQLFKSNRDVAIKFYRLSKFNILSTDGMIDLEEFCVASDIPHLVDVLNGGEVKTKKYSLFLTHNTFEGRLFNLIVDLTVVDNRYTKMTKEVLNSIRNKSSIFMKIVEGLQFSLGYIMDIPDFSSEDEKDIFVDVALSKTAASTFNQTVDMASLVANRIERIEKGDQVHIINYIILTISWEEKEILNILTDTLNSTSKLKMYGLQHALLDSEKSIKEKPIYEFFKNEPGFKKLVDRQAERVVSLSLFNEKRGEELFWEAKAFSPELIDSIKNSKSRIEPYDFIKYVHFVLETGFSQGEIMNVIMRVKKANPGEMMTSISGLGDNQGLLLTLRKLLTNQQLITFNKHLATSKIKCPHELLI